MKSAPTPFLRSSLLADDSAYWLLPIGSLPIGFRLGMLISPETNGAKGKTYSRDRQSSIRRFMRRILIYLIEHNRIPSLYFSRWSKRSEHPLEFPRSQTAANGIARGVRAPTAPEGEPRGPRPVHTQRSNETPPSPFLKDKKKTSRKALISTMFSPQSGFPSSLGRVAIDFRSRLVHSPT